MSTHPPQPFVWLLLAGACAAGTALLLVPAIRWLRVRALAHPNARSGHTAPTPQGAGLVAIPVFLVAGAAGFAGGALEGLGGGGHLLAVAAAAALLMAVGFLDDARPLPVIPRFAAQSIAVLLVLLTLPATMRVAPFLPLGLERACLFVALAWFVNLTNFMDGMDGITAAEAGAITFGLILLSGSGYAPQALGYLGGAMLGAMAGFAVFNAPPARVFFGDAGSLPLGLLLGTMLIHLAAAGAWAAALILPLYYLLDASLTLAFRLLRRERFWEAHRQHYYQRALRAGRSVTGVLAFVLALNAALVALAVGATALAPAWEAAFFVGVAIALVFTTLSRMAEPAR